LQDLVIVCSFSWEQVHDSEFHMRFSLRGTSYHTD
jgi:hypothetical protein